MVRRIVHCWYNLELGIEAMPPATKMDNRHQPRFSLGTGVRELSVRPQLFDRKLTLFVFASIQKPSKRVKHTKNVFCPV